MSTEKPSLEVKELGDLAKLLNKDPKDGSAISDNYERSLSEEKMVQKNAVLVYHKETSTSELSEKKNTEFSNMRSYSPDLFSSEIEKRKKYLVEIFDRLYKILYPSMKNEEKTTLYHKTRKRGFIFDEQTSHIPKRKKTEIVLKGQ